VFDRDREVEETDLLEQGRLVERGLHQRAGRIGLVHGTQPLVERTGVHADADRGAVVGGRPGDVGDLVVERLDVARIDPHLRATGFDGGEDVARLEVDIGHHRDLRFGRDRGQRVRIVLARHSHAHDVATGCRELGDLLQGGVDVGGERRGHRLNSDRGISPDVCRADLDLAGRTPRREHHGLGRRSSQIDGH